MLFVNVCIINIYSPNIKKMFYDVIFFVLRSEEDCHETLWCQIRLCPIMLLFHPNKFSTHSDQFIDMINSAIIDGIAVDIDVPGAGVGPGQL